MSPIALEQGVVLGFGGTNARVGISHDGEVRGFTSVPTPEHPQDFFGWMALQVLDAADKGHSWLVAGFPGPVSPDGRRVGPMVNVPGLAKDQYDLTGELTTAEPAVGRLVDEGFALIAVNDGELAAHAAADRVGQHGFNKVAALILGTGVGAGIVEKDPSYDNVYRADSSSPNEIGYVLLGSDPADTFENRISGPAIASAHGKEARELSADHPAWEEVGELSGRLAILLGVMNGADLVVPCGGVGAGASDRYGPHLQKMIAQYREKGDSLQGLLLPEIIPVPQDETQIFELFGGEGVMRDFTTRGTTPSDQAN